MISQINHLIDLENERVRTCASYNNSLTECGRVNTDEKDEIGRLLEFLASDRVFLFYSTENGGMIAEAFGDLMTANSVAIVIPGMGTTVSKFGNTSRGAKNLFEAMGGNRGASVATIAWLGYDPPDGLIHAGVGPGGDQVDRLESFVSSALFTDSQELTVVAHSYGSLLMASAALPQGSSNVDNIVFIGSPGYAEIEAPAALAAAYDFYLVQAPGDPIVAAGWITHGGSGSDDFLAQHRMAANGCTDVEISGHSDYLLTGSTSLFNTALVATGQNPHLSC